MIEFISENFIQQDVNKSCLDTTHSVTHTYLQSISKQDYEVLQIQHQVGVVAVRLQRQRNMSDVSVLLSVWLRRVRLCLACVPYRVCPQGGDDFGQRQLPKLLHVRSIDQTLCRVKDVILHHKEAGWRGAKSTEKDHERSKGLGSTLGKL